MSLGQEVSQESEDVAKITIAIESYVSAFNSRDADTLVAHWTPNGVYTSRTTGETSVGCEEMKVNFQQVFEGEVESSGLQIIGWDEKESRIRSWLFDSDGGVMEGVWSKRSDGWSVQSVATLADGGSGSFTSIFRPQSDGSFTWEKINQVLDGKLLLNIDELQAQRN